MTESEYISFWKSVRALVNLHEGSEISLDWLGEKRKFIRARDERGRFTGTQSDTLAGWVRRMEKDGRYKGYLKRGLKEIFILQLLSGRIGHRQPQYSQKYRKRKEKTGAFAEAVSFASSFKVIKESFDPTQQSVYNLYYSGESMEEFYKSGTSKITEDGKSDIRVEFSITPSFASAEADANEHGRTVLNIPEIELEAFIGSAVRTDIAGYRVFLLIGREHNKPCFADLAARDLKILDGAG